MTDNEIITTDKAIETLRYEIDEECHCDYIADEIRLLIEQYENTRLNLREAQLEINRQKAEIERLNTEKKALLLTVEKMRKEIRRLQVILVNFMDEVYEWGNKNNVDTNNFAQAILVAERDKVVKQIKSEAIKEFAERLKDDLGEMFMLTNTYFEITLDNLVTEMTEKE